MTIQDCEYKSWREFRAQFLFDLFGDGVFRRDRYLFRGHASIDWRLISTFDRNTSLRELEGDPMAIATSLLSRFREHLAQTGNDDAAAMDDTELMALGQHYGLPTRLLDWTESPYYAIYFALYDRLNECQTHNDSAVIWALDVHAPTWNVEKGVQIVRIPHKKNLRMRNQAGAFTLNRTPLASLEEYVRTAQADRPMKRSKGGKPVLWRLIIRELPTIEVAADLAAMGITAASLFSGIAGAAMAARIGLYLDHVYPE